MHFSSWLKVSAAFLSGIAGLFHTSATQARVSNADHDRATTAERTLAESVNIRYDEKANLTEAPLAERVERLRKTLVERGLRQNRDAKDEIRNPESSFVPSEEQHLAQWGNWGQYYNNFNNWSNTGNY